MSIYTPVAIINVGTGQGQSLKLPIFIERDPVVQATAFVHEHKIPETVIPRLTSQILLTLNALGLDCKYETNADIDQVSLPAAASSDASPHLVPSSYSLIATAGLNGIGQYDAAKIHHARRRQTEIRINQERLDAVALSPFMFVQSSILITTLAIYIN